MNAFYKIGFGTWEFGGRGQPKPDNDDAKDIESITALILQYLPHNATII